MKTSVKKTPGIIKKATPALSLLTVAALALVSVNQASAALDNGVDPANLGKGDWIWQVPNAEANVGANSVQGLVNFEATKGVRFVIVKGADGGDTADWTQFNTDLVTRFHAAGIKVFAFQYVYGSYLGGGQVTAEINAAKYLMGIKDSSGVSMDGLMIDAEFQYNGEASDAITYCSALRAAFPTRCLSHSPYPIPSNNASFPYIEFGRYCDVVMPQDYWYDQFAGSGGITPQAMADQMNSDWLHWQGVWQGEGDGSSVKPLAPIGQGFQGASPVPIPGSQLTAFLNELNIENPPATAGGYKGISFWVCDQHTSDEWSAIGAMGIGSINSHINPCVARTSDGRLETFAIGNTGFLYHNYQNTPGGTWSGWIALGTTNNVWTANGLPAVATNHDGRLELFLVGTDGSVNHIYQKVAGSSAATNWVGFSLLSSSHVSQTAKLAVGTWANGTLDVFVIGTDGALYHDNQVTPGGSWSGFVSLGGTWSQDADIAVNSDKNGEVEALIIGNTGNLYNNWQTSINGTGWHGWNDLGGTLNETVRTALGHNSDGRLEIFTLGTDGVVYHDWETAVNGQTTWNGWASLGGSWAADAKPVVGADANGALEVFLIGKTGNLYHNYQTGGSWSGWVDLNGTFTQNVRPCVGANQSGTLQVILNLSGGAMDTASETAANSTTWTTWSSLGGTWK